MSTGNPRISIGLHFSNTYCCTAAYDGTSIVTIPDGLGNKTTPNCLVVHDDKTVVGDLAKKAPFVYRTFKGPLYTIESMLPRRRPISNWFDLENENTNVEGELLTVEQVSKGIISYLKRCAERHTNTDVTQVAVVVPQSFTQNERCMVQRASNDAGLTIQLLTEPAAASLAYYNKTQPASGSYWLVFSLAQHTLDLAVFSTTQNVQYTKAVESTDDIGGQDFDGCFINQCIQNFQQSSGIDLNQVQTDSFKKNRAMRAISKLRSNWESARSALARGRTMELSIDGFFNSEDLEVTISSAEWKSMAKSHMEKCIGVIKTVLQRGGVDKCKIKDIIPVGNSPWNTLVLQIFADYCGIKPSKSDLHPEEIAAMGAAIQAYRENNEGSPQAKNVAEVEKVMKFPNPEPKKTPPLSKMVRVNFDHSYTHNGVQGRIAKGEILHLIEKAEPKWWTCRRDGEAKAFFAPAVFLSVIDTDSRQYEANLTSLLHNPRDSIITKRMAPQPPQQQPARTTDSRPLSHAIGIDIGSTYCCIAIFKNGQVVVIPNELGQKTTPSYVTFHEDDDIVVGEASKSAAFKNYSTTVHSAKRLLGRPLQDSFIQQHKNKWPFRVISGGETDVKIQLDEKILAPEDVTKELVRSLKENAQTYLGVDDLEAVVTVPVHFTERQRILTQQACQAAGLNVLQLMTEPAAAAVAYHQDRTNSSKESNCLIFDLGGSTFDVAVLKSKGNIISIRTIGGDATLGGEDFDNALVKLCMDEFQSVNGIDMDFEKTEIFASNRMRKCMLRLKKECEKQKSYLTTAPSVRVGLACFLDEMDMDVEISRKTFEGLIAPYLDRCIKIMAATLMESGISKDDIDDVLLVGGSTRIPLVEKMLKEYFGRDCILVSLNPDEVVAAGAAIQAASVKNPHGTTLFVEQPDFISSIAH